MINRHLNRTVSDQVLGDEAKWLCLKEIQDDDLRRLAKDHAETAVCSFCGRTRKSIKLRALASIVEGPLQAFCSQGELEPYFEPDSDNTYYEQGGESLDHILQNELSIDVEPAEALARILVLNDPAYIPHGEEPFFSDEQRYERRPIHPWDYIEIWEDFAKRITHFRRYFDAAAREHLAEILGTKESDKAADLPEIILGGGTNDDNDDELVFRARLATDERQASRFVRFPAVELSAPPPEVCKAGRMNPSGISVFYGALSEATAIAEVRPPVGGIVVVGAFSVSKRLRVLDLTRLGEGLSGSIFAPGYEDRAARLTFLQGFHSKIARPVLPHEEDIGYVPTQAVAEYVVEVLGFDGILYASAQVGAIDTDEYGHEPSFFSPGDLTVCNVAVFARDGRTSSDTTGMAYVDGSARAVKIHRVQIDYAQMLIGHQTSNEF